MTPDQMSQLIKKLRGGMSLRDFAAKCGVSHTTIDNLERGIDPRTGKPPQIKMATYEKIISACGLPSIMLLSDPEPGTDIETFVDALHRTQIAPENPCDELWAKITQLDEIDRGKVEGFVSALLAAEKYQEPTHLVKIAARTGGGIREVALTESQIEALKNLPEVPNLDDKK